MSATAAADRVHRGAQLLDREIPGWAARIDLEELQLNDPCGCILGQLHPAGDGDANPYETGLDALGIDERGEVGLGFCPPHGFTYDRVQQYAELDRLWTAEILARLSAAGTSGGER